jgi:hypothetical protein
VSFRAPQVLLAAALLASCARDTRPPPSDDLTKLKVSLAPGPMRLMTQGSVFSVPAEVFFDVGSPLSTATTGCFEDGPQVEGQVETGFPDGTRRQLPELTMRGLTFGGQRYVPVKVGIEESKKCEVVLGIDVLLPWALSVDLARRELTFLPSATRPEYQARALEQAADGYETHQLELTRDPVGDWPMLALRVKQADEALVAPLVFSTREATTRVSTSAVRGAGLKVGRELFDGLPVPEGIALPTSLVVTDVVATDGLELSPGFGVSAHSLKLDPKWEGKGVAGVLGGDVWGRFDSVIDVQAGVLWLKRPRVLESGTVQRCVRGAVTGEEGCYELFAKGSPAGLEAAVTLWRSLPSGGRLYLDVTADAAPPCRIGFSFGPSDRGASAHFLFPWGRMTESMPECAAAFAAAKGAKFSLYEDGPLAQCPGTCAFAEDALTRRISCACDARGELTEADRTLLRLYKMLLEQELKKRDRASEPADP